MSLNKPIQNKLIYIYGLTGSGKTFASVWLSAFYERVIANLDIYHDGKKTNTRIRSMYDVEFIEYSDVKGLCILDESAININSRRGMSQQNIDFLELSALSRKKNCDFVFIAQREMGMDKGVRELCSVIIEMESYFIGKDYLMFEAKVTNRYGTLVKVMKLDLFKLTEKFGFTYDTLENSKIERKNNEKNKKEEIADKEAREKYLFEELSKKYLPTGTV